MSAIDAVDGSRPPAEKCQITPVNMTSRMTAVGTKQTFQPVRLMSAIGGKADMGFAAQNVCF